MVGLYKLTDSWHHPQLIWCSPVWKYSKKTSLTMFRTVFVMLVILGLAFADESDSCDSLEDCECGSVCTDGKCEEGCMVFDQFMPADSESEIYGRMCQCLADPDEEGRPILCAEDVKFEGQPKGIKMYVHNSKCDHPAPPSTEATA